jgi:superkiller protein 3
MSAPKGGLVAAAERELRAGNLAKAEASFRKAVDAAPEDAAALVGLARCELVRGRKKPAEELLARAERSGRTAATLVTRGVFAEAAGDRKAALAAFREATKADAKSGEARFNLGRLLAKDKKLKEAEAALVAATELDPENAMYEFHLAGVIGRDKKRIDACLRHLQRAIELNDRFLDAYCLLADVLAALGELGPAEKVLRAADRRLPETRQVLERLAVVHQRQKKIKKARDDMREVAGLAPKDAEVWRRLALLELASDDIAQASACAKEAARLAPKSAEAHFAAGIVAESAGKRDDAKAAYRKAVELDAKHWGALTNLGRVLLNEKKPAYDEVVKLEEKARALAPKEAAPVLNLAFAYAGKGDKAKAAATAKLVLTMPRLPAEMKKQATKLAGAAR